MKSANWHDIAELMGIAAVVGSLLFVGLQMQQTQEIARTERNASELANTMEVSDAIIAHADIWVRGNAGDELTSVEEVIFSRLVRNVNDLAYFGVQQERLLGLDEAAELEIATYAGFLYENPGARRVWRAREGNLQRYRRIADSEEQVTSNWIKSVEFYLAAFDQDPELMVQPHPMTP